MRHAFNGGHAVTRAFGIYDPVYANYPGSKHPGTDYVVPANTPLVAGMSGTVTAFDRATSIRSGRGKEVVITHGNKQRKTCHMNRIDVVSGQQVAEGQAIGLSGNTGFVLPVPTASQPNNGAHLHDELLIDGVYVDLEKNLSEEEGEVMPTDKQIDETIASGHQAVFGSAATDAVFRDYRPLLKNNYVEGNLTMLKQFNDSPDAAWRRPTVPSEFEPAGELFVKKSK